MEMNEKKNAILLGETVLGIELGSTRIKGVLLDRNHALLAKGSFSWENRLEDGLWTYHLEDIWAGLQACFKELKQNVWDSYGVELKTIGAIGISAMMHGYLVFDANNQLLTPFRTWRNTMTAQASAELSALFAHPIPQRWSIAHLYQSVCEDLVHVPNIRYMTTLSGYIHWMLSGEKVLGIDDASGMFPIDPETKTYHTAMLRKFDERIAPKNYPWKIGEILPKVLTAGEQAGRLSEAGAKRLDPSGSLQAGIPLCAPAGDAGTGMVATNSVKERTGNVSAGTSIFSMIVLERPLTAVYSDIDIVATPGGSPVAMVHCNNCTSDLNAWVQLFKEFCDTFHIEMDLNQLYTGLFNKALEGDADGGGLLAYNYFSGEHITHFEEGRPLFAREQNSAFTLANFMRTHLMTALCALRIGNDLLVEKEGVQVDSLCGHGGFFNTKTVGQSILAAALNTPVSVMETSNEGGAWGIAVLAGYMIWNDAKESLADYLENKVFSQAKSNTMLPDPQDAEGFNVFLQRYKAGLSVERAAVDSLG